MTASLESWRGPAASARGSQIVRLWLSEQNHRQGREGAAVDLSIIMGSGESRSRSQLPVCEKARLHPWQVAS